MKTPEELREYNRIKQRESREARRVAGLAPYPIYVTQAEKKAISKLLTEMRQCKANLLDKD